MFIIFVINAKAFCSSSEGFGIDNKKNGPEAIQIVKRSEKETEQTKTQLNRKHMLFFYIKVIIKFYEVEQLIKRNINKIIFLLNFVTDLIEFIAGKLHRMRITHSWPRPYHGSVPIMSRPLHQHRNSAPTRSTKHMHSSRGSLTMPWQSMLNVRKNHTRSATILPKS